MEAKDWQNFIVELYREFSSHEPSVVAELAKAIPNKFEVQYEFESKEEYGYWEEWLQGKGIVVHLGKAPNPGCRIIFPSTDLFEQVMLGKTFTPTAAIFGMRSLGPLSALTKVGSIRPLIAKVYPEVKARYSK